MNALYQVWLKLSQWFRRRSWKCEKFTTKTTDNEQILIRKLKITVQPGLDFKITVFNHFFMNCSTFFPRQPPFSLPAPVACCQVLHVLGASFSDQTAWLRNLPLLLHRKFTYCGSCMCQRGGHSHRIYSWVPMQQFLHILKERPRLAIMTCLGVPLLDDFVSKIQQF